MVECKGLKKMDFLGKSDPFVQVFLMPGKHREMKTKVIKKNINPVFDETFKFVVSKNFTSVTKKTIVFRVFDRDKLKTDEIGEVGHLSQLILAEKYKILFKKVQISLWKLDLSAITDEWGKLHRLSGTKDKVLLLIYHMK